MSQPNFLLFVTDQQRADHLGCYGNDVVRTPEIDSVAERGVRFDRFHVATPLCQPNRATLATGRMPSVHGVRQNGIPLSLRSTTFVQLLRAAGYRTALVGKSHLQNVSGAPPGKRKSGDRSWVAPPTELREAIQEDRTGLEYEAEKAPLWREAPDRSIALPYYGYDHVRICASHGDQVEGHYSAWLAERHPDPASLRGRNNAIRDNRYSAPQCWRTSIPEELYPTTYVAEETVSFLRDHATAESRQPFFAMCSFPDPHHPFTPPGKYWDMYAPEEIRLPGSFRHPIDPSTIPPVLREAYVRGRDEPESFWPVPVTERHAREIIALNYGAISMVDAAVGRVLTALDELGLSEDTIVVFTSDHGDYMGDHGVVLKSGLHYQSVIRVPFIWSDPMEPSEVRVTDRLSGTIDIASTILARAKLQPFFGIQGIDLFAPLPIHRRGILVEDYGQGVFQDPDARVALTSLITDRWRMSILENSDWGELYDLENDPDEIENLWRDGSHAEVKCELMELLTQEMLALRDRAISPTGRA